MSDVTPSDSLDEQSWLTWLEQRQASTWVSEGGRAKKKLPYLVSLGILEA